MKLRKSRLASRSTAEPDGHYGSTLTDSYTTSSNNNNSSSTRRRTPSFGIFDNFRKSSSRGLEEEQTRLLQKGSYVSERTEPTDALTVQIACHHLVLEHEFRRVHQCPHKILDNGSPLNWPRAFHSAVATHCSV